MTTEVSKLIKNLHSVAVNFGSSPLLVHPNGTTIDLAAGYIPLLANFTLEDKAAKRLRKRTADDKAEPPVYFSALELVRDQKALLLSGSAGSGKTTFAKHLCYRLVTDSFKEARHVSRNDFGDVYAEVWDSETTVPWYFEVDSPTSLRDVVKRSIPGLVEPLRAGEEEGKTLMLILLDVTVQAGDEVSSLLTGLVDYIRGWDRVKLLVLGDSEASQRWILPFDIARYDLLPLLKVQRRQALSHLLGLKESQVQIAMGEVAKNPALFAMALEAEDCGHEVQDLLDMWLSKVTPGERDANKFVTQAFSQLECTPLQAEPTPDFSKNKIPLLAGLRAVQQLLAARHLARSSPERAITLFHQAPDIWEPVIRSLLTRLGESPQSNTLVDGLIEESYSNSQRGALLAADSEITLSTDILRRIKDKMLQIFEEGTLSPAKRKNAGRVLSQLGDPRDLEAFTKVEAGSFILGSDSHPNSQPARLVCVESFSIGIYPVVNRDYLKFIEETGREWRSIDGRAVVKRNIPATDLTWHDARAYCSWATLRWRAIGKIQQDEHVRLPTEVEWERASRGNLTEAGNGNPVWPWGSTWRDSMANVEELGLNEPCAVGLFPTGRSPYGCYDMAGQVWEWCSTLWGEDMSTPTFRYPYRIDDGREALDAPETVRRVLRGGCFSSGRLKASSSYRGSLEPAGSWRGNGFRVVVARDRN